MRQWGFQVGVEFRHARILILIAVVVQKYLAFLGCSACQRFDLVASNGVDVGPVVWVLDRRVRRLFLDRSIPTAQKKEEEKEKDPQKRAQKPHIRIKGRHRVYSIEQAHVSTHRSGSVGCIHEQGIFALVVDCGAIRFFPSPPPLHTHTYTS